MCIMVLLFTLLQLLRWLLAAMVMLIRCVGVV